MFDLELISGMKKEEGVKERNQLCTPVNLVQRPKNIKNLQVRKLRGHEQRQTASSLFRGSTASNKEYFENISSIDSSKYSSSQLYSQGTYLIRQTYCKIE